MTFLRREQSKDAWARTPGWARVPFERPPWAPADARILTGFDFATPGKYRIRAVYAPLRKEWIEKWKKEGHKAFGGLPEGTTVFQFESAWIDFEVSP